MCRSRLEGTVLSELLDCLVFPWNNAVVGHLENRGTTAIHDLKAGVGFLRTAPGLGDRDSRPAMAIHMVLKPVSVFVALLLGSEN